MRLVVKYISIGIMLAMILGSTAWATTKAWFLGSEKAFKLNVQTNAIEKDIEAPVEGLEVFLDARRGNLFLLYSPGRFINDIAVYDVNTLSQKGKLDLNISSETTDEVQIIFPSSGNLFYLRWVKEEDGPPEIVAYDATTFKPLNRYTTTPATTNKLMLSAAGDFLYSIRQDENTRNIDIYQTADFTYKSSIDISKFITLGISSIISGYSKGKVLISEVITRQPQFEYFEYILDIPTTKTSTKIRTAIKGADFLLSNTNRFAISENQYVGKYKSMRLSTDYLFTGKIYVFDAVAGEKIGTIQIPVAAKTIGDIIGVSPSEDKLYVRTYNASGDKNPKLYIVDLITYGVIKEIALPEISMDMVFFEE